MTFEEFQQALTQMLAVQRELQESQLKFREAQEAQRQEFQAVLTIQRDLQESQLTQR